MEVSSYELSRQFFDWSYENPEKIKPNHIALYFFIIEHCNRLGWKDKFGLPTEMAKEAIGIKNYRTYYDALNDLVEFGFIKLIEKSKNQYSSNIIAIVKNTKAHTKAYDKARHKQVQKQGLSTVDIDKPINPITIKPNNSDLFNQFILIFNSITNRSYKGDKKSKSQFNQRIKEKFSLLEFEIAIKNASNDKYLTENNYLTPEYITRSEKLQKWLNYKNPNEQKASKLPEQKRPEDLTYFEWMRLEKEKESITEEEEPIFDPNNLEF